MEQFIVGETTEKGRIKLLSIIASKDSVQARKDLQTYLTSGEIKGHSKSAYDYELIPNDIISILGYNKVTAQVINNDREHKWRLKCVNEVSPWSSHYEGLLVHTFKDGRTFCYATAYWEGELPIETPFQVFLPKK